MESKKFLLVDGNSIGFAAQSSTKLSSAGNATQAIFGVLRTLRVLVSENPGAELIVYWDGKSWRKEQCEAYKANREDTEKQRSEREEYRAQRPIIARALHSLGVRQRVASNMEADDLIAMDTWALGAQHRATIVSGDRDLLQLVTPQVDWLNPIKLPGGKSPKLLRVDAEYFADLTGYETPQAFVQGKALLGDASDNLKGVDGIGEKAAPLVVKHWGTVGACVKDLRENGEAAIPKPLSRYRKKLLALADPENREQLERYKLNIRMMWLSPRTLPPVEGEKDIAPIFDAEAFTDICLELGFVSITRDFEKWTRPFANA